MFYGSDFNAPECFISQLAFTSLNGFLLTTDGRLFSWGANTSCIGRTINDNVINEDEKIKIIAYHEKLADETEE